MFFEVSLELGHSVWTSRPCETERLVEQEGLQNGIEREREDREELLYDEERHEQNQACGH